VKALVIGSEGNIGVPLVRHLRARGYDVLESDVRPGWRPDYLMADINHPVDLLPAFDWAPDVVFLLSAMVSRVTCEQAGSLAIATNLAGINNALQLVRRAGARLVFFSTSEVYGPECDPDGRIRHRSAAPFLGSYVGWNLYCEAVKPR
jgi:nucleoside-diphosphate-sugar epimerase